MLRGNRGEWSEVYAFLRILADGKIKAADADLRELPNSFTSVIRVIRKEKDRPRISYFTGDSVEAWTEDGEIICRVDKDRVSDEAAHLYYEIISPNHGGAAFEIPSTERFMSGMQVHALKAPSEDKSDIVLQIRDARTGVNPICGWSIKSELGSAPTLFNAGRTTNFTFMIDGCDANLCNEANAIASRCKIKDRLELLSGRGRLVFRKPVNSVFERNLRLIDSKFPEAIAEMLLIYFGSRKAGCREIVDVLEKDDPLRLGEGMYEYKFKKFLCAAALGMMPSVKWDGRDDATGGYIVVREDGEVLAFHIYNRDMFEDYLLENTKFDTASSTRHDFGAVYKEGSNYFINLNLQIRFK